MKEYPKSVDEIAYELQGSCKSLYEVLEANEMEGAEMDTEFCLALDQRVFECECCGWWFEMSEMYHHDPMERWICIDCGEDDE